MPAPGRASARVRRPRSGAPRSSPPRSRSSPRAATRARGSTTWRKRAGVAKGTIYLYFADKEALFQELVRSMVHPVLGTLEQMREVDIPARMLVEGLLNTFVREIYGTRRKDIDPADPDRGPALSGDRRVLLSRGDRARARRSCGRSCARAAERGELRDDSLARFPQLIVAPVLVAIMWNALFERFEPLDVDGDDARAYRHPVRRRARMRRASRAC